MGRVAFARCVALLLTALALSGAAQAESVLLTGSIGNRAILIVDGSVPKTVAPGQTFQNVRVLSVQDGQAVVEVKGQRLTLRMDSPVSVGGSPAPASGSRIVLPATSGGHFMALGSINGRAVNFMVDTGATVVALSVADAERVGLAYKDGQRVTVRTANGEVGAWRVKLNSVRIGDVDVADVDAVVSPQAMPFVLLGNSFTSRFSMRRDGDQMVLERRY